MKKIIFMSTVVFLILFFLACGDDSASLEVNVEELLTSGIWVLDTTDSAIEDLTPFKIIFYSNGTGETRDLDDELISTWTWSLDDDNKTLTLIWGGEREEIWEIDKITSSELIMISQSEPLIGFKITFRKE